VERVPNRGGTLRAQVRADEQRQPLDIGASIRALA